MPKETEARLAPPQITVARLFADNMRGMSAALATELDADLAIADTPRAGECKINLSDTASMRLDAASVDFVLTSPPYCTRIDYTAATRIELAVLWPLLSTGARALGKQMIGSAQVPSALIEINDKWGRTCARFLEALWVQRALHRWVCDKVKAFGLNNCGKSPIDCRQRLVHPVCQFQVRTTISSQRPIRSRLGGRRAAAILRRPGRKTPQARRARTYAPGISRVLMPRA